MGDVKRLYRDYQSLMKCLDSAFDGQVLLEDDALNTDTLELNFTVRPNAGLYKTCEIKFLATLNCYPKTLDVVAISVVCHPNICFNHGGEICLNVLDEWTKYENGYKSLELLVQGILFLFYEPNFEGALAVYAAFDSLSELEEAVESTKCGSTEYWTGITFDNIYKGAVPSEPTTEHSDSTAECSETPKINVPPTDESDTLVVPERVILHDTPTDEVDGKLRKSKEDKLSESHEVKSASSSSVVVTCDSVLPFESLVSTGVCITYKKEGENTNDNSDCKIKSDKSPLHLTSFVLLSFPVTLLLQQINSERDVYAIFTSMANHRNIFGRVKQAFNVTLHKLKSFVRLNSKHPQYF
ncbi:uncharacterized protein [Watersipora subatra]|uniref:uncharacterized protein n=1 Tax=Watersipora subatra TaxID=2589382 RepID=UPI00355BB6B8